MSDELEVLRIAHASDMLALKQTDAVMARMRAEHDELKRAYEGALKTIDYYRENSMQRGRLLFEAAARAERMASKITRQRSEIDTLQDELFVQRGMAIVRRLLASDK